MSILTDEVASTYSTKDIPYTMKSTASLISSVTMGILILLVQQTTALPQGITYSGSNNGGFNAGNAGSTFGGGASNFGNNGGSAFNGGFNAGTSNSGSGGFNFGSGGSFTFGSGNNIGSRP
ncbi:hypothetical protein JR316_0004183 [Psilocybe cubensis]|uniref:Uncharacterized protein n=2 Tax=Psilocybe cubensis TaxID=181762 RepID=A0A8H7XXK6_PSICU|nr:hypothetical protein JR316_0004183 [Psilocybe cubensis]KAH9482088.1 hypothetical protein JR316_0004183 [Psilocybe cubensis]